MAVFSFLLLVLLSVVIGLYIYQKRRQRYWAERGIPYDKPDLIFGTVKKIITHEQSVYGFLEEQYRKYKSAPVVGAYAFSKPFVIIRDLDIVKDVTIKEFGSFVNRSFRPEKSFDSFAGRQMFSRGDDEWRTIRHSAAHVFTNAKLKCMFPIVKDLGRELVQKYEQATKNGESEVEITDLAMRYAVDSITGVAFGSRGNSLRDHPGDSLMYSMLGKLLAFGVNQGIAANLIFFARPLYVAAGYLGLPLHIFPDDVQEDARKIVGIALEQRLQEKERKNDVFDHFVWSKEPELQGLENKAAAAFQMLVAGSETSAVTSAFALYELARHPHLQDRLRKEIVDALNNNNGEATYDLINDLEYLDQIVKETLRLWPTLPFLDRICQKEYKIPGTEVVIEKGTHVYIPMNAIQRDPQYFPDPDKFDPERFSKENIGSIPEMAFIPFGIGPRFCVGKRFGVMNVKSALVQFLSNFQVRATERTFTEPDWNPRTFTLNLKEGMYLSVKPLHTP